MDYHHHLGCMKTHKLWDKPHINWRRISSINSISIGGGGSGGGGGGGGGY